MANVAPIKVIQNGDDWGMAYVYYGFSEQIHSKRHPSWSCKWGLS